MAGEASTPTEGEIPSPPAPDYAEAVPPQATEALPVPDPAPAARNTLGKAHPYTTPEKCSPPPPRAVALQTSPPHFRGTLLKPRLPKIHPLDGDILSPSVPDYAGAVPPQATGALPVSGSASSSANIGGKARPYITPEKRSPSSQSNGVAIVSTTLQRGPLQAPPAKGRSFGQCTIISPPSPPLARPLRWGRSYYPSRTCWSHDHIGFGQTVAG